MIKNDVSEYTEESENAFNDMCLICECFTLVNCIRCLQHAIYVHYCSS